ncbi:MAG: hypothetical protein QJR14_03805 [Bacillota bacterium]|nr:hypothetical protein [Bacillota bacterium]
MARVGRTLAVLGAVGAFVAGGAAALRDAPGVVQAAPGTASSGMSTAQLKALQESLSRQVAAQEQTLSSLNDRERQLEQALAAAQQQLRQEQALLARARQARLQAQQAAQAAPRVDTTTGASSSRGDEGEREHDGISSFFGSGEEEGSEGWGE